MHVPRYYYEGPPVTRGFSRKVGAASLITNHSCRSFNEDSMGVYNSNPLFVYDRVAYFAIGRRQCLGKVLERIKGAMTGQGGKWCKKNNNIPQPSCFVRVRAIGKCKTWDVELDRNFHGHRFGPRAVEHPLTLHFATGGIINVSLVHTRCRLSLTFRGV